MKKTVDIAIEFDEIGLITHAQKVICEHQCPESKEGDKWIHSEPCRALRAWLLYKYDVIVKVAP